MLWGLDFVKEPKGFGGVDIEMTYQLVDLRLKAASFPPSSVSCLDVGYAVTHPRWCPSSVLPHAESAWQPVWGSTQCRDVDLRLAMFFAKNEVSCSRSQNMGVSSNQGA